MGSGGLCIKQNLWSFAQLGWCPKYTHFNQKYNTESSVTVIVPTRLWPCQSWCGRCSPAALAYHSLWSGPQKWPLTGPVGQCDGVGDRARWRQAAWMLTKLVSPASSRIDQACRLWSGPASQEQGQEEETGKAKSKCLASRSRRAGPYGAADSLVAPRDSEQISLFLKLPDQVSTPCTSNSITDRNGLFICKT